MAGEISTFSMEKRYFRKDGSTVWINLTVSLLRCASGAPNYFIAVSEDITERKRAEAALHRLGVAVEGVTEIITLYDAEDRLIFFNGAFRHMNREVEKSITLGMTFEELIRIIVANGLVPEAAGREEAWLRERLERHRNPGDAVEIARQDGIWLLTHEQRLPDGGSITISQDITERRRADAALRASEARLAGLLDIAPEAVISIDVSGRIQLFNQGAEAIFGYRSKEIMGRRLEIAALRKDGGEFPAASSISKLGVGEEMLFHRGPAGPHGAEARGRERTAVAFAIGPCIAFEHGGEHGHWFGSRDQPAAIGHRQLRPD